MIWAGLAVLAAVTVIGVWQATRWADRRWDHHVESALRLADARQRHPAMRVRCMCGRFVLGDGVEGFRAYDHGETFIHRHRCCQPAREVL